jgi:hypothetical protein
MRSFVVRITGRWHHTRSKQKTKTKRGEKKNKNKKLTKREHNERRERMNLIEDRAQLLAKFTAWAGNLIDNTRFVPVPEPENVAIILAKDQDLAALKEQLAGGSVKLEEVRQIRDMYLQTAQTPQKLRSMEMDVKRVLHEFQTELREIQELNLEDLVPMRISLQEERLAIVKNLSIIDDLQNQLPGFMQPFATQFEATTRTLREKLARLPNAERVTIEPQGLEQEREAQHKYDTLRNLVKNEYTSRHATSEPRLAIIDQALHAGKQSYASWLKLTSKYQRDIADIEEVVESIERKLVAADSTDEMQTADEQQANKTIVKIDDQPVVRIFLITPPPKINLKQKWNKIQKDVAVQFRMFQWPAIQSTVESTCNKNFLNPTQMLSYHYFSPFNTDLTGVLFKHSTGSGKTPTLRLCASTFARDGYDVAFCSPPKIALELAKVAFFQQADFNVQQFTRGRQTITAVLDAIMSPAFESKTELAKMLGSTPDLTYAQMLKATPEKLYATREPSTDVLQENAKTFLFGVLKEMGVRQYQTFDQSLTYDQLSNLSKVKSQTNVETFLFQRYKDERKKDLFYKLFIGIDEAHNFVAEDRKKSRFPPEFLPLRDRLWASYKLKKQDPSYQCAVVALMTATPIVSHPLDVINLISLCYYPDEALGFNDYGDISTEAKRKKTQERFMEKEFNQHTMKFYREEQIKQFFGGYVSYFDSLGDRGKFAQPFLYNEDGSINKDPTMSPVTYVNVKLSMVQMALVGECFKKDPGLLRHVKTPEIGQLLEQRSGGFFKYNAAKNELILEKLKKTIVPGGGSAKTSTRDTDEMESKPEPKSRNRKPRMKKLAVYDDDDNNDNSNQSSQDEIESLQPKSRGSKTSTRAKSTKEAVKSSTEEDNTKGGSMSEVATCLATNVTFPWLATSNEDWQNNNAILSMSKDEMAEFVHDGSLRKYSPLMCAVLTTVRARFEASRAKLERYYEQQDRLEAAGKVPPRDPITDFAGYKLYIFVDTTKDKYSTDIIAKILQSQGYVWLNEDGPLRKDVDVPYKNFIVMNSKSEGNQEELLPFFNSPENADGRKCSLIIMNGLYKEGVNLQEVSDAIVLGYIATDADLRQAVARIVRTCSRKLSPFAPGHGQTVGVTILSPSFPTGDGLYPLEIIEMLKPERLVITEAINEMDKLLRESAYDKLLLENINQASEMNQKAVRLWEKRREP